MLSGFELYPRWVPLVHEQLRSTIYEQSISPVDDTMAEDLIVSRHSQ